MILEDAYENSYITYVANHCLSMTTAWVNVLVVIKSALYTLQGGYILYWMEAGSLSPNFLARNSITGWLILGSPMVFVVHVAAIPCG